jgi:RNA polymerase sigma factor (sigma-70 family)
MSNAVFLQLLDRWLGAHECDADASFLTRFVTRRDDDAFAALVHRHGSLVYGTCLRILGNRDESDDAFQAVFFVLARRAHTLKLDRSIGPWLHGVAIRVARKLRDQIVKRRLREMAAARSERVEPAQPNHDFWALLDEELACLARPLREVLFLCDLNGQSHAEAAKSLGLAKGTVTKRLAKAHGELAARLRRRGITLGAGVLSGMLAAEAAASVPALLVVETAKHAVAFSASRLGGPAVATGLAEAVLRSLKIRVFKVWLVAGLLGLALTGGGMMLAARPEDPRDRNTEAAQAKADTQPVTTNVGTMWKETYTLGYSESLPVSVAFSADGQTLVAGDTRGEVMAFIFPGDCPSYTWKSAGDGSPALVAYSADYKNVYVATANGVRIHDAAARGKDLGRIDAPNSNPTSLGVFPNKAIDATVTRCQIVFGNARGYFVKSWAEGKLPESIGTIETSTGAQGEKQYAAGVPLAVDPKGRSAIMTGPRDPKTNQNVLWAYVCGDHEKGSPGNRVLVGHSAPVTSAAWAREGTTAVTGDADGRVIVWDARAMKETRRVELGGRVLALAISSDGTHVAAWVRGKRGGDVYSWKTAQPLSELKPIHTQLADLHSEPFASLSFAPDGKKLAGCVIDKDWLKQEPKTKLNGKVHVWELAPEPKAQPVPLPTYTTQLPKGASSFAINLDFSFLRPAAGEGAIHFFDARDGHIQGSHVLGHFTFGRMIRSSDRRWLAVEQHPAANNPGNGTFDVGVLEWPLPKATIPSCSQILDIASGGTVVAVVREKKIELWDIATTKLLKSAPFQHTRIDAATFSPDGKLLALSDHNDLLLWKWEENTHERIDLGHCVGSLAFSPDGKFLAEGPMPGESIQIRDLDTRKIVQTLRDSPKKPMNVAQMVYIQGSRVLITSDHGKDNALPHHIKLWDTVSGSIAHQITLPAGLPRHVDVTPNGRIVAVLLDEGASEMKISAWRLDGLKIAREFEGQPSQAPATDRSH